MKIAVDKLTGEWERFRDINEGQVFIDGDGDTMMKIGRCANDANCVMLETGRIYEFEGSYRVYPVDAKVLLMSL